jgi:DNA-binding CsgD family transcriptional regulator
MGEYKPSKCRIALIQQDDSLFFIGDYGWSPSTSGERIESSVWRSASDEVNKVLVTAHSYGWNAEGTILIAPIRERGVLLGSILMIFPAPVEDVEEAGNLLMELGVPMGMYLTLYALHQANGQVVKAANGNGNLRSLKTVVDNPQFTQRQILVLNGMVEGLTNHEIAGELGYSVSTIRHESMRIYEILGVSDRHEAAKVALEKKLV